MLDDPGRVSGVESRLERQPGPSSSATVGTVAVNPPLGVLHPFLDHGAAARGMVFNAQAFSVAFIP